MRTLPAVVALLLASHAGLARAERAGVVVTGEATLQPQLAAELEGWLREHGRELVGSPLDPDAINTLIDCFVLGDESCARNVVDRSSKSPTVIYARIEVRPNGDDGTRDVTLVGYWLQKNAIHAIADRRHCERCTEKSLRGLADALMVSLSHLATPSASIGLTAHARTEQERPGPSRVVPGALIGGGAALAITGGVMIAMGAQVPAKTGVQPASYLDYRPPGYALGVAGLAAAGVGVYLWMHGDDSARSRPIAAVSPSGGYVGWTGRF
jgi:hypothetical protein